MAWTVLFDEEFADEFANFNGAVKISIESLTILLRRYGPQLGRPHADTLNGSKHANMKEPRLKAAGGVWRVAYAFDPERNAILLVAGDKAGVREDRFYRRLIRLADARYDRHVEALK